ncbi:Regulator of chromosome condensation (RCC1) repeat protein [compost metagenome]
MAVHADGSLSCWGKNSAGTCGAGDKEPINLAKKVFFSGVTHAAGNGYGSSCIVRNSQVLCSGDEYSRSTFAPVSPNLTQVTDFDGSTHFCAVSNGAAYCWGWNAPGVLGASSCSGNCELDPQAVQGMETGVTAVSVGYEHACGIKAGQVYCWGDAADNQLGSAGGDTSVARLVTGSPTDAIAISVGYSFGCAARASGGVICWGFGFGATPTVLTGTASLVVSQLSVAAYDKVFFNSGGQSYIYNGSLSTQTSAWDFYQEYSISGGTYNTVCGIQSGSVICSGSNYYGNLGLSDPSPATKKTVPFPVYNLF